MSVAEDRLQAELAARARKREEFLRLVARLEREALEDPAANRRRVRNLALVGYGYVFGLLAICVGVVAWTVRILLSGHQLSGNQEKLLFVFGFLVVMIVRSLWVKLDDAEGVPISRGEAPALYAAVDAISEGLQAPRTDQILLTHDVNAAAVQVPRLGIFGSYQNLLILGVPLLLGLTPDEARGVIAHEMGHFSGRHGQFGVWIYRVNRTWRQLATGPAGARRRGLLFDPFLRWFYPRFSATSFALRRTNEYEADRAAASVVGPRAFASALLRLAYLRDHLDSAFWTPLMARAKEEPTLPPGLFARLEAVAKGPVDPALLNRATSAAFADVTGYGDTHPSLTDRLTALAGSAPGTDLFRPPTREDPRSAADVLLGEAKGPILARLEADLVKDLAPRWAATFSEYRLADEQLRRLEAVAAIQPLTERETRDLAYATLEVKGVAAGEARLRSLLATFPNHAEAALTLGNLLLERDDEEGLEFLRIAEGNGSAFEEAARAARLAYLARHGRHDEVAALQHEAAETQMRRTFAENWSNLLLGDEVSPPDFSDGERARMRAELAKVDLLQAAYAVAKVLPGTGETRTYLVVFFKRKLVEAADNSERLADSVRAQITHPRPIQIEIDQPRGFWERKLRSMPEALIFDRKAEVVAKGP